MGFSGKPPPFPPRSSFRLGIRHAGAPGRPELKFRELPTPTSPEGRCAPKTVFTTPARSAPLFTFPFVPRAPGSVCGSASGRRRSVRLDFAIPPSGGALVPSDGFRKNRPGSLPAGPIGAAFGPDVLPFVPRWAVRAPPGGLQRGSRGSPPRATGPTQFLSRSRGFWRRRAGSLLPWLCNTHMTAHCSSAPCRWFLRL